MRNRLDRGEKGRNTVLEHIIHTNEHDHTNAQIQTIRKYTIKYTTKESNGRTKRSRNIHNCYIL